MGQTQGRLSRQLVKEAGLNFLAKYVVVQVDCDRLTPQGKRELFSATRDRLRHGSVRTELETAIGAALSEDEELQRLDEMKKNELLTKTDEKEAEKLKRELAKLIDTYKRGPLPVTVETPEEMTTDTLARRSRSRRVLKPQEPIPSQTPPTFIRIANREPIKISKGTTVTIRVETDASSEYVESVQKQLGEAIAIFIPAEHVKVVGRSALHGGRIRFLIRVTDETPSGYTGHVVVELRRMGMTTLSDAKMFEVAEAPEKPPAKGKPELIQDFDLVEVNREHPAWQEFNWDEHSAARVEQRPDTTIIWVSIENENLVRAKGKLAERSPEVARRFHERYVVNVAFFAWQQSKWKPPSSNTTDGTKDQQHEPSEEYKEGELERASKTIVNALGREAALMQAEALELV